jgi:hypothetical protein
MTGRHNLLYELGSLQKTSLSSKVIHYYNTAHSIIQILTRKVRVVLQFSKLASLDSLLNMQMLVTMAERGTLEGVDERRRILSEEDRVSGKTPS